MPNLLIRIVAIFLVPCLIPDPAFAGAAFQPAGPSVFWSIRTDERQTLFESQAFVGRALWHVRSFARVLSAGRRQEAAFFLPSGDARFLGPIAMAVLDPNAHPAFGSHAADPPAPGPRDDPNPLPLRSQAQRLPHGGASETLDLLANNPFLASLRYDFQKREHGWSALFHDPLDPASRAWFRYEGPDGDGRLGHRLLTSLGDEHEPGFLLPSQVHSTDLPSFLQAAAQLAGRAQTEWNWLRLSGHPTPEKPAVYEPPATRPGKRPGRRAKAAPAPETPLDPLKPEAHPTADPAPPAEPEEKRPLPWDELIQTIEAAARESQNSQALGDRLWILAQLDLNPAEAVEAAHRLQPTSGLNRTLLALALYRAGDYKGAFRSVKAARRLFRFYPLIATVKNWMIMDRILSFSHRKETQTPAERLSTLIAAGAGLAVLMALLGAPALAAPAAELLGQGPETAIASAARATVWHWTALRRDSPSAATPGQTRLHLTST